MAAQPQSAQDAAAGEGVCRHGRDRSRSLPRTPSQLRRPANAPDSPEGDDPPCGRLQTALHGWGLWRGDAIA
eukprot:9731583-Alexandrium_andersonii.AAC.1